MVSKIAGRLLPYVFLAWTIRMLIVDGDKPIGKIWPELVIPFAIGLFLCVFFDLHARRKKENKDSR